MNEDQLLADKGHLGRWEQHKFLLMVGISIAISLFLVGVALALYANSGTAQLDLSRPGYQSVRQQAARSDSLTSFPADGPIDSKTLEQFRTFYEKRAEQATNVDGFGGNVMSDESLSLNALGQ
jgi:hypothetical protein